MKLIINMESQITFGELPKVVCNEIVWGGKSYRTADFLINGKHCIRIADEELYYTIFNEYGKPISEKAHEIDEGIFFYLALTDMVSEVFECLEDDDTLEIES